MSGTSQEMAVALDIRNLREPGCGGSHPVLGRQSEGHRKFQTSLRYRVSSGSTWVSDRDPVSNQINQPRGISQGLGCSGEGIPGMCVLRVQVRTTLWQLEPL